RHEDVAEAIWQRGDRRVVLARVERSLRAPRVRIGDEVELVGQCIGPEPAGFGTLQVEEGVAQSAQEVAEVVFVPELARTGQYPCVSLLDEVLGVLPGSGQCPGRPVQPIEVVAEASRLE